jgi:DNA-binding NtrC family response regulator
LVDEDAEDIRYYSAVLRRRGYDVEPCSTYSDEIQRLQHGAFDFIVVSQGSSAFEGKVVLERAIEIDRHLPVLVLASRLLMSCYLDAMQLGAVDYLEKHVHPQDLVWVLETHLLCRNRAGR